MTRDEMEKVMLTVFEECQKLREAGQKEYAHGTENAFRNFESIAAELETTREKVLWTYAKKHMDGIVAYIRGYESQREPVEGRINDLITYLCLLRGMVEERRLRRALQEKMDENMRKLDALAFEPPSILRRDDP